MSGVSFSLRTRFALGLGSVLLPFLAAAAVGQFYLLPRLIEPTEEIVRELTEEMEPVMRLQMLLLQAAMPVNDYLIHGDAAERRRFAQLRQRVERAFKEASPEQYALEEERALIRAARAEWLQALSLGEQMLRLPDPVGKPAAARDMERFDAHLDQAVSALDEAHDYFRQMLERNREQAGAARTRAMWVTFTAFLMAAAASLYAGVALARSVTDPVNSLREGAARLAEGKLSHRVAIHRNDELGELAEAFNTMAGRIRLHSRHSPRAMASPGFTTTVRSTSFLGTNLHARSASIGQCRCCCLTSTTSSVSMTRMGIWRVTPFSGG